jgi:MFS family permease
LIDKYSVKLLMLIGSVVLGAGLILHALAETPTMVYLSRALFGVALGLVGVTANVVLVSKWFRRLRGTAIGIALTGTSIGGVLIPLIATPLIISYGWRTAMIILSLVVWIVLIPAIILLVRNHPGDIGLSPDGDSFPDDKLETESDLGPETEETKAAELPGMSFRDALRTPIFWVLALCALLIFYPIFVTTQQFILYLQTPKIGMTASMAGIAQAALFFVSVGGKISFGLMSDRILATRVMLICCTVMFLATLVLIGLSARTAFFFIIPFGLGYGGTFVLLQRLTADYFGIREYGKILGAITFVETVGAAVGGLVTSRLADAAGGDYSQAFYGVIIVTALALLTVILLNFMVNERKSFA